MRQFIETKRGRTTLRGTIDMPQLSIDQKAPVVIFFHDIMSSSRVYPSDTLAQLFIQYAYAVVRFDFSGHGRSDGRIEKYTLKKQIEDAKAMVSYVSELEFTSRIILLGHGIGGNIAAMIADEVPCESIILLGPSCDVADTIKEGLFYNRRFNKKRLPRRLYLEGRAISKHYLEETRNVSLKPCEKEVLILQGKKDEIVSYKKTWLYYKHLKHSTIHLINNGTHDFRSCLKETCYWIDEYLMKKDNHS